jgi:Domain of unknown function (DUF5077)/Domain of unknown function (DUF3472)
MLKKIIPFIGLVFCLGCSSPIKEVSSKKHSRNTIEIPFGGNAFLTVMDSASSEKITENGLENWTSLYAVASCYFKINKPGILNLSLQLKKANADSEIKITVSGKSYSITTQNNKTEYFITSLFVKEIGYVKVDLQGIKKYTDTIAYSPSMVVSGIATDSMPTFANDKENYYWSRRGPSCHLNYKIPTQPIEFFYSEILVPKGEDKIGSYFMANGFSDGYFGIQVNSKTERRVLFSVWEEDNKPKTIMLKKGAGVISGRFDGEGTGGQSYLVYDWKPDITYKFLTKGVPDGAGNTIYTSWFYMPGKNTWQLMASFKRQNKSTYLTGLYSFIENFEENNGYMKRKAFYTNQWIKIKDGNWLPVKECSFSIDATGRNKQRLDFNGGIENGKLFLENGGFTKNKVLPKTVFSITNNTVAPTIAVE